MNVHDDKHGSKAQPTLQLMKWIDVMRNEQVLQCQLSEAELRGFIAEAEVDDENEVAYVDHVKAWVPIVFELRKSRVYEGVLARDWGTGAAHLIDLDKYENKFPLLPDGVQRPDRGRAPSRSLSRS